MTADLLRTIVSQRPFRPCRLVLTGGFEVAVPSPGALTIRDADTVEVLPGNGHQYILDLAHVIEVRS